MEPLGTGAWIPECLPGEEPLPVHPIMHKKTNHFLLCVASEISGLLPSRASPTWPIKLYNSLLSVMLDPEHNWNCKAVSAFKKLTKLLRYMPREGFLNRWPG